MAPFSGQGGLYFFTRLGTCCTCCPVLEVRCVVISNPFIPRWVRRYSNGTNVILSLIFHSLSTYNKGGSPLLPFPGIPGVPGGCLNVRAVHACSFIAITRPLRYVKHRTNSRRVLVTLAGAWLASAVISSPIAFGMNHTETRRRTPHLCTFYNSYFLIFSSMGSFYIPCVAMLALYWRMFQTIRERARQSMLRRRHTARNVLNVDTLAKEDAALNEADRKPVRAAEISVAK